MEVATTHRWSMRIRERQSGREFIGIVERVNIARALCRSRVVSVTDGRLQMPFASTVTPSGFWTHRRDIIVPVTDRRQQHHQSFMLAARE